MTNRYVASASISMRSLATLIARARKAPVEITRHGRLEAVLISPELFERIRNLGIVRDNELLRLQDQFNELILDMRSAKSEAAYTAVENISAQDLAGAVAAARTRLALAPQQQGGRTRKTSEGRLP